MRLEYFQRHRTCVYVMSCKVEFCKKVRIEVAKPHAVTKTAADHARHNPGHEAQVVDVNHLEVVSTHLHQALPLGEAPPF